jgi:predicted RNase H-like HicB family nuclease
MARKFQELRDKISPESRARSEAMAKELLAEQQGDEAITYTAVYERDADGRWLVEISEVSGCHSHGATIDHARERIREALGLYVDDAETATIIERFLRRKHNDERVRPVRGRVRGTCRQTLWPHGGLCTQG